mgnify:CR=1 FL=1
MPFQSTLPLRGATNSATSLCKNIVISIHAPLTGSDLLQIPNIRRYKHFNPRSPYGERRGPRGKRGRSKQISIHAPLTGSDRQKSFIFFPIKHFNPRSPYGERQVAISTSTPSRNFNPRSPYGERQQDCTKFYLGFCLSSTIL